MNAIFFAAMVIVQTPLVKLVPLQQVHAACGDAAEFDACTAFLAYRLSARCVDQKLAASIDFQPLILLNNLHRLDHEQQHIEDIRSYATAYVTDIEQKHFDSDAQCRSEAQAAMTEFSRTMHDFAARSMRHIH